jgi:integrase
MRGSVASKCMHRRRKDHTRCSSRCRRWYYVVQAPPGPDGKRRRHWSKGFATKREAEVALTEELRRRDLGVMLSTEKLTVRAFADRWLDHMTALGRDERTIERYRELLDLHVLPYLGGQQLKALQTIHLSDLHTTLLRRGRRDGKTGGLHPRTVGHVHRALHRMLKQAVRWQLIATNPAADLELPTIPKAEMATLTREQAAVLLNAAQARALMRNLVMLGVATGARLGELLALCWTDIDLDAGTVKIGWSRRIVNRRMQVKGPKTETGYRTVILGPATLAALRRLQTEQAQRRLALGAHYHPDAERRRARQALGTDNPQNEYSVICKPDGRPYRPDSTSTQFRAFVDALGLPKSVHVHTLRHSAASFLAAAGVPASDIAAQLGHKDGGALALKVYVHPMAEGLAKAGAHLDQIVGGRG